MSSEWLPSTVGQFCPFKYGKNLPERDRQKGCVPVVSSAGIVGKHNSAHVESGGVVVGRKGTVGSVTLLEEPFWPIDTAFYVEDLPEVRNLRFTYYLLRTLGLEKMNTDSAVPGLNRDNAHALRISVPKLKHQREIAESLQALDDRITLLRETNATPEAIAQALFKSWFVDFDPVRAKLEGRAPEGMDEATAALFPDGFEESELGLVPRGWRIGKLGDILALRSERTSPSVETALLPYVPIASIPSKNPFLDGFKSGEEANSSLVLFCKGDILSGAMRPYFHKVCQAPFNGVSRSTVFTLKSKNSQAAAYALFVAFQASTVAYATQHSEGSTIPYAKWPNSFEKMPLLLPPKEIQESFSLVVSEFIEKANCSNQQAQTLATLRDTLLPRLISGQLRLPEVS